ncbi:nucleotidyltransferase domain-containing protein [Candidatus Saganbacteria bacterium]|nr:nucleotidyltransferase domain-containing protein [Candidatus Saganbacteria bacterium]
MNIKNDPLLNKFVAELKGRFKNRLKKTLLFGSRARGSHTAESDYDCILLLDDVRAEDKAFVDELESKILLEDFVLVSAFLMTEYKFESKKYEPFIMNAKKEGILL